MSPVLATVSPSAPRRILGTAVVGLLGGLLIWLGLASAPALGWRVLLLAFGGVALFGAIRLWQATSARIELTETELRDSDGTVLARLDQITAVERGAFAFKPSNGFLVRVRDPQARGWAPGMWWRMGRRVGIGGVTSASEGKAMAERLALEIARRHQGGDRPG